MALRRVDIKSLIVGSGPIASLLVLKTRPEYPDHESMQLPIKIGSVEARAISHGVEHKDHVRPLTHDLLLAIISSLGARLSSVRIMAVEDTTFFAQLELVKDDGTHLFLDARPSDAVALAVRSRTPVYVDDSVLSTAAMPDFKAVKKGQDIKNIEEFHTFVEHVSPDDFS